MKELIGRWAINGAGQLGRINGLALGDGGQQYYVGTTLDDYPWVSACPEVVDRRQGEFLDAINVIEQVRGVAR